MSVTLNRRSKVLLALVACMTLGSGLLLALSGDPVEEVDVAALSGLIRPTAKSPPAPDVAAAAAWQRIVIHSSRTAGGSLGQLEREHERAYGGCAYHFVISADGTVQASRRWERQEPAPPDADGSTVRGIQVVLIGRFDNQPPGHDQFAALQSLVLKLTADHSIPKDRVLLHCHVDGDPKVQDCPGRAFPVPIASGLFEGPTL